MTRNRTLDALLVAALGLLAVTPAQAASATKVTADWKGGASGLPSDITMYIYVPTKVATNPPLLTLVHSCAGSGPGVFGQATGNGTTNGGVVQAAEKYGFIMVMPDSGNGRCWDVSSKKSQTREGGGDSHAILQMVRYAIAQYQANADRVYATGCSSGAMMTQLLLALYPDVYKAGSSFAGVPAGCSNVFDGSGLCGLPSQTAQQWGDRVVAMSPNYSGRRPRVQLVHGDGDTTITYKNQAEAIKEWTNVLKLATTPTTTTASGLTLGTHQATRQSWKSTCGYVVLDALTSVGGDHGPSDALFQSTYVLPFLGLDSQAAVNAAVDPEIEQCGGGTGGAGAGGSSGAGGATGGGGSSAARDGGLGGSTGNTGAGGSAGRDAGGSGGAVSTGGSVATGGSAGSGGNSGKGGATGTGGSQASGGRATGGSPNETGGTQGSGGAVGTGGKSSAGGSSGSGSGGQASSGGAAGSSASGGGETGCSCALGKANANQQVGIAVLVFGLALAGFARRRHR